MIFKCIDFHESCGVIPGPATTAPFRLRINHVVDSLSVRIPPKIKTEKMQKLNVVAMANSPQQERFWELEGYANVELRVPDIATILKADQAEAVMRVKKHLKDGIRVAAAHDRLFASHLDLWNELLATADQEYDHYFSGMSRSHSSRKWRCEAVWRITPNSYRYDIVVRETKSSQVIERHNIKTTECQYPFNRGIGFSKLRWEGNAIIGLTKEDKEAFRVETSVPTK
jgi:hypothetical protein